MADEMTMVSIPLAAIIILAVAWALEHHFPPPDFMSEDRGGQIRSYILIRTQHHRTPESGLCREELCDTIFIIKQ